MKKKMKIFLIVFGIILLSAAGYLLYMFKFKQYDVADEEIDEIMEEVYTIELPDGTVVTMDEDGTSIDSKRDSDKDAETKIESDNDPMKPDTATSKGEKQAVHQDQSVHEVSQSHKNTEHTENKGDAAKKESASSTKNAGDTGNNAGKTDTSGKENVPTKPSVADIKNKYVPTFEALQSQADSKLNALIGRAKAEYSHKQANGETINVGYFYNKYYGAADTLEAQTDSVFQGVLQAVEQDLVANGYNESYAQSFLDDYNAKKKARRDSILNKALGR